MTAEERVDVAIVGGGISGLALGLELRRKADLRVTILERSFVGGGATTRNVGRIRAMQLMPDLTRFAIAAQAKHAGLSDELRTNTLFWRAGYAWVLYEPAEMERIGPLLPMYRDLGLRGPRLVEGAAVVRRLPILRHGETPLAAMIGRDAIGHHDAVLYAYLRAARHAGADVREGTEVRGIVADGDRIVGVETSGGTVVADTVVNATDGWSREVSAMAGVDVPNAPIRREVFVTEPASPLMREAITFYRPIEGWFNQTLRGEVVAGVTAGDEPVGMEHRSSFAFLTRTAAGLMRKAPRLGHLRVIRQWAGVYDLTPDRLPVVGPVASRPGFVQMNGYSGRGFALAPLVAELLAAWLVSGRRPDELAPFDPDRFVGHQAAAAPGIDYYAGYR